MKKILIQLDTDAFASTFDNIVAYDAGIDIVQSYGGVRPDSVRSLVLSALFTRGVPDLKSMAVWIGGSDAEAGEMLLDEARRTFFGPFRVSLMLDSNGCNTTASTAIAKLAGKTELTGKSALVVGPGPVGVRVAVLLAGEGCRVGLASVPRQLLGEQYREDLAKRTLDNGRRAAEEFQKSARVSTGSLHVEQPSGADALESLLDEAEILVAAGPAGLQILSQISWSEKPNLKCLVDFNLTEPLGIEGVQPSDDFAERGGKLALGALAIGNQKMTVHKACLKSLFERNDLVLDAVGVFNIAKRLI